MCPKDQYSLHKDKDKDKIPTDRDSLLNTIPRAFRVGPLGLYDSATELQAKVSENTCMATFIKYLALTEEKDIDPGLVNNLKVVIGSFEAAFRRLHGSQAGHLREATSLSLLKTALKALEGRVPKQEVGMSKTLEVTGSRNPQEIKQVSPEESAQAITPSASAESASETATDEPRGAQARDTDQLHFTQTPEYLALAVRLELCLGKGASFGLRDLSQMRPVSFHRVMAERGCALYLQSLLMCARIDVVRLIMQEARRAPPRRHLDTAKTMESSYQELVESVGHAEEAMKTAFHMHEPHKQDGT